MGCDGRQLRAYEDFLGHRIVMRISEKSRGRVCDEPEPWKFFRMTIGADANLNPPIGNCNCVAPVVSSAKLAASLLSSKTPWAVGRWSDQSGAPQSSKMGLFPIVSRRFPGTGNVLPSKSRY
jgi:hypothetical protein